MKYAKMCKRKPYQSSPKDKINGNAYWVLEENDQLW